MDLYNLEKFKLSIFDVVTEYNKHPIILWFYFTSVKIDQVNYSLLPIHSVRKSDYIFLADHERSRKIWEWAKNFHGYSDSNVRFFKLPQDTEKSEKVEEMFINALKEFENRADCVVVNMHSMKEMRDPCEKLNLKCYGNKMDSLPDKRWLHSCVPGSKYYQKETEVYKVNVPPFPKDNISVPLGYSCYSKEELVSAKKLLSEKGVKNFFLKAANSIGGSGSYSLRNDDDFDEIIKMIDFGNQGLMVYEYENCWILQEKIDLKVEERSTEYRDGSNLVVGLHFYKGKVFELCTNGIINGGLYFTTTSNTTTTKYPSEEILKEAYNQGSFLADYTKELIPEIWEVEFLIDKNNKIFLSDLNVRFTDSDQAFSIMSKYGFNSDYSEYVIENVSYDKALKIVEEKNLIFNKLTKKGIFVELKFTNSNDILILIFAENKDQIKNLYNEFINSVF